MTEKNNDPGAPGATDKPPTLGTPENRQNETPLEPEPPPMRIVRGVKGTGDTTKTTTEKKDK